MAKTKPRPAAKAAELAQTYRHHLKADGPTQEGCEFVAECVALNDAGNRIPFTLVHRTLVDDYGYTATIQTLRTWFRDTYGRGWRR